jgi:hypothetical protein
MGDIPTVTTAAGVLGTVAGGGMSNTIKIMSCPRHGYAAVAATQGKEDTTTVTTTMAPKNSAPASGLATPTAHQAQGCELVEDAEKMVEVPLNDDGDNDKSSVKNSPGSQGSKGPGQRSQTPQWFHHMSTALELELVGGAGLWWGRVPT